MKNLFLLAITAVMALTMHAYSFMVDGLYYDITSPTTVSLTYENTSLFTNYHSLSGELEIPSTVYHNYTGTTYRVTAIGTSTFYGCQGLTSVIIPNSVTAIDDAAFDYCHGLTSVTIPNSVTSIGCIAFRGCSGLTSVTIPNSVTSIEGNAFWRCSSLTSIIVDDGNTVYDSRENCNAIIETASNTLITGCQNTIIPKSVTAIGDDAFCGCTGLTSIDIPNSVTSMGEGVFAGCSSLTSVHIPNSIIAIQSSAFLGCASLTSVNIPNSVTLIGGKAFSGCTDLTRIDSYADPNDVLLGLYAFNGVPKDGTLHVLPQYLEAYQTAEQWCEFTNIVADLQQEDYLPFVREGVKWIYYYDNPFGMDVLDMDTGIQYYSFEMKGDVLIGDKYYKPVVLTHYLDANTKELEDFVPVYLREENKVVYAIQPDGIGHPQCPVGIDRFVGYSDKQFSLPTEEFILYDFNDPISFYDSVFYEQNHAIFDQEIKCVEYLNTDTIIVGKHQCKRHHFKSIYDEPHAFIEGSQGKIIEGIGYDGYAGMPLFYFQYFITGFQVEYYLSHVIEDDQIIYKGAYYNSDISLGINEVVADLPQRQLDGNYYNLMGQPVGKDVPTVPGIYIHQGKKILVR